jgi:hypothetical protein
MFDNELFADITIKTGEGSFKAAKCILSKSPVLQTMLCDDKWIEGKTGTIEIDDIRHEVMYEMVRYLYCDKVPKITELAADLMIAADKYDVPDLKEKCAFHLTTKITIENFAESLIAADQVQHGKLKKAAINFIVK